MRRASHWALGSVAVGSKPGSVHPADSLTSRAATSLSAGKSEEEQLHRASGRSSEVKLSSQPCGDVPGLSSGYVDGYCSVGIPKLSHGVSQSVRPMLPSEDEKFWADGTASDSRGSLSLCHCLWQDPQSICACARHRTSQQRKGEGKGTGS